MNCHRLLYFCKMKHRYICSNTHRFHPASLPSVPLVNDLRGFVFVRHVDCLGRSFFLCLFVNPSPYTRPEREKLSLHTYWRDCSRCYCCFYGRCCYYCCLNRRNSAASLYCPVPQETDVCRRMRRKKREGEGSGQQFLPRTCNSEAGPPVQLPGNEAVKIRAAVKTPGGDPRN